MVPVPNTSSRSSALAALAIGLAGVVLYLQTVTYGLLDYDDTWLFASNYLVRSPTLSGLYTIWFDLSLPVRLVLGAEYLPLRDMSVLADFLLHGSWFGGFHLTNVLLYGAVCAVAVRALQRWTGSLQLAWMAGLLYATHPLHVESVAWLSERKGLLCALFVLLGALAFRGFCLAPSLARWLLTALLSICAVWSKAPGVLTPGLLLLLTLLFPPRADAAGAPACDPRPGWGPLPRPVWLGWAGLVGVTALAFWPVLKVGNQLVVEQSHHGGSLLRSIWLSATVLGAYLRLLLYGGPLGIQYAVPAGGDALLYGIAGGLAAAGLLGLVLAGLLRQHGRWPALGLGAACFLLFYLPVSQLIFPLQNIMADRYMLLPSLGFCLLTACLLSIFSHRAVRLSFLIGLAILGAGLSGLQGRTWADTRTLNLQALRADAKNITAMLHLCRLNRREGKRVEAWRWLNRARALSPDNPRVLLHLGLQLSHEGRQDEAIAAWVRGARLNPGAHKVRANLALLLLRRGQVADALGHARQAVRLRPEVAHNQRTLGVVALESGHLTEAQAAFTRAVQLEPSRFENQRNMGVVLIRRGRNMEAARWLKRALGLRPGDREVLKMLGRGDGK